MSLAERLQEISFDLYERYILLRQIAGFFRTSQSPYRILDVGGHTAALWPGFESLASALAPGANVIVADMLPEAELRNYVRATGMQLPFRDRAFDLVCSLDTLEHIPADGRAAFIGELIRVTRDGLYLAFPFDSPSNRWAESVVREYTNVTLKTPIPALLEHRQFGLPDRDNVGDILSQTPYPCVQFGQGNTDVWLLMMMTYHTLRQPGTDFVEELNRRFNQSYGGQDWTEPQYRAGYVLSKCKDRADLETLRASFVSGAQSADLRGVQSFCELFLNIAQSGRVTVDKDRHIGNIEHQLTVARPYVQNWSALAEAWARVETKLLEAPPAEPPSPANWSEDRMDRTLQSADDLQRRLIEKDKNIQNLQGEVQKLAGETGKLDGAVRSLEEEVQSVNEGNQRLLQELDELRTELEENREQTEDLRRRLDLQERLETQLRELEIGLVTNRRAVQAIYDSRIWKALSRTGGLMLRMTGHRPAPEPTWTPPPGDVAIENLPRGGPDGFLAMVCDYPGEVGVLPVRDIVEIRGWVLAKSGIDRVVIQAGADPPASATYGLPRLDVARNFPSVPGAEYCGFRFFWDTAGLPEGPCTVNVTAVSRNGQAREATCHVVINWKTPPEYGLWIARNEPSADSLEQMRVSPSKFRIRPRISIAVPVYKTPVDLLTRCLDSVVSQTYPDWELCLADDASHDTQVSELLQKYAKRDSRIHTVSLEKNKGISGATNAAMGLCTGEYLAFLDHDDELAPFALSEVVQAINQKPDVDMFYSDEDKIDEQGRRYDVFFKPDWSPDLFRSCNYVCHFVVMKRELWKGAGGLSESYNGSQDYEFLLRASERTSRIARIPKVLYHWRAISGSAALSPEEKPAASVDGQRALAAYLERNQIHAEPEEVGACRYRVRYAIAGEPKVSILVPTGGHKNVFRALDEVVDKTAYKNYEIVLIDNSRATRIEEYAAKLVNRGAPVRYFDWRGKPFNFSRMNNEAARTVEAPYLLFLNDDTKVISAEWLTAMLEHAQRPEVGAVGAQLWYPNNVIQHAGVVMGIFGNCSHAFKGLPGGLAHYFDFPNLVRNCSAVTGACLMVGREKFFKAGAFDEVNLAVAFQDVDLCLKLLELGYRNVYTPYAKLYHFESATKTDKDKIPDPIEDAFMKKKWAKYIADDPYYNPNLARRKEDYSLALE